MERRTAPRAEIGATNMAENKNEDGAMWGCAVLVLLVAVLLSSHLMSGGGAPSSKARAQKVLSEERDAARYTVDEMEAAGSSGDHDRVEALFRARNAHLQERIQEIESSSEFTSEDKERILRPMRMEAETMGTAVEAYDGLSR